MRGGAATSSCSYVNEHLRAIRLLDHMIQLISFTHPTYHTFPSLIMGHYTTVTSWTRRNITNNDDNKVWSTLPGVFTMARPAAHRFYLLSEPVYGNHNILRRPVSLLWSSKVLRSKKAACTHRQHNSGLVLKGKPSAVHESRQKCCWQENAPTTAASRPLHAASQSLAQT